MIATLLREVGGFDMSKDVLTHWDTVRVAWTHKKIIWNTFDVLPCLILRITGNQAYRSPKTHLT